MGHKRRNCGLWTLARPGQKRQGEHSASGGKICGLLISHIEGNLNQGKKLEAARSAYLWLLFACFSLSILTFPLLTLPFLYLPYLSLPLLTYPYLSLPFLTFPNLISNLLTNKLTNNLTNINHDLLGCSRGQKPLSTE